MQNWMLCFHSFIETRSAWDTIPRHLLSVLSLSFLMFKSHMSLVFLHFTGSFFLTICT